MPSDLPMAEPARTRRSSRTAAAPVQAPSETPEALRPERRRRQAAAGQSHLVTTPGEVKHKDDAPAADLPFVPAPSRVPSPSAIALPATPVPVEDPLAAASPRAAAAPRPAAAAPVAPLTRRARRSSQAAQERPVALPPIAPVAPEAGRSNPALRADPSADAPLMDAVLAPAEPFELLEPAAPLLGDGEIEDTQEAQSEASGVDEFEAAARLFSFTGETPVQVVETDDAGAASVPEHVTHAVPRRRTGRGNAFRRATAASFSVGIMGIVGLLTVGMTTPAEAVAAASGTGSSNSIVASVRGAASTTIDPDEIQAYVAPASVEADTLERTEKYGTVTRAELASEAGIQNFSEPLRQRPQRRGPVAVRGRSDDVVRLRHARRPPARGHRLHAGRGRAHPGDRRRRRARGDRVRRRVRRARHHRPRDRRTAGLEPLRPHAVRLASRWSRDST